MRYSKEGNMYGYGIYFAVRAAFSNLFAYDAGEGVKQIFCANVIIG